jgi:nucleoside-diphosphate-sugar epimerase
MRILVIGGTGFTGPYVVRELVQNHEVAVFHRGQHHGNLPPAVRRFTDPCAAMPVSTIPIALREFAPEVVLHTNAVGERDVAVVREAFTGVARRLVMLSSGDVYRAYGVFKGLEPGPLEPQPLHESAALRSRLYPYRSSATRPQDPEYHYEKILAERAAAGDPGLPATILRLPKLYGAGHNAELASVYAFRHRPQWRWTHGFVGNVARAIVAAIEQDAAAGRIFNVGEASTPTVAERLAWLPPRDEVPLADEPANFAQHIVYDTQALRRELSYSEALPERTAMQQLLAGELRT